MSLAKSYRLDCQHDVWYTTPPIPGDVVFCQRCNDYSTVPNFDNERGTYHPNGDFTVYKIKDRIVRGVCRKCGEERRGVIQTVQKFFNSHEGNPCNPSVSRLMIDIVDLPPNSPPPF